MNELSIAKTLSLSLVKYASTKTNSSPSGSNANKSGVITTKECWSKFTPGNGFVICIGVPIRITKISNQSEKELSATWISINDSPGINIEPLIVQDATPFSKVPSTTSPIGKMQDTLPKAADPSRIVTSAVMIIS